MTSSDRRRPGGTPAEAPRAPSSYTRFIPREEVGTVEAWTPGSFGGPDRRGAAGDRRAAATPPPGPDAAELARRHAQAVDAARQAGYRDGYRDGLVALEGFKQSYAQQVSAQVAEVVGACQTQLDALQRALADAVTHSAVSLARQVVRQQLEVDPQLVSAVAREAIDALLESARQLTLRLHPDDVALVAAGASDTLQSRGVRLVADAAVTRGGCVLDADIGRIDATVEARWARAVGQLGVGAAWDPAAGTAAGLPPLDPTAGVHEPPAAPAASSEDARE